MDLKRDYRRTALACSVFGLVGIALTILAIHMVRSGALGDIPKAVTFRDTLVAGGTWTIFLGGLSGLAMLTFGILGVHSANHKQYERSQLLWGLGLASFGLGIAAIPIGVIVDGSRSLVAWVFLALGASIFLLGLSECGLRVEESPIQSRDTAHPK
jgi:hypothetical protein